MSVFSAAALLLALALEPDPFIPEAPPQAPPKAAAQAAAAPAPQSGVHISLAEWDALKEEIRALKAENAELRKRLEAAATSPVAQVTDDAGLAGPRSAKAAPAAPAAPADVKPLRRNYSGIEVGMTRQEVDRFIKSRRDLKIVSVQAHSGVQQHTEETVIQRSGTTGQSVTYRGGPAGAPTPPPVTAETDAGLNQQERQVVQRKVDRGKRETITVAQVFPRKVQTGTQRNSLGGTSPVYGTVQQEAARLTVELTDDVVTAVNGTLSGRYR